MSAKWGKADIAPQRLMSANYLKRAHGGTTMRAIVILSITLIGLALVLKNCAGDYYGVPLYCNDAYETGMADGSFDGKRKVERRVEKKVERREDEKDVRKANEKAEGQVVRKCVGR
jgi:hypothetical protein